MHTLKLPFLAAVSGLSLLLSAGVIPLDGLPAGAYPPAQPRTSRAEAVYSDNVLKISGELPFYKTGARYAGIGLRLPETLDLTNRKFEVTAASGRPFKALEIAFYNRGTEKPAMLFRSWNAPVAAKARTFTLEYGRSGVFEWVAGAVSGEPPRLIDRIGLRIGGTGSNQPVELRLYRLEVPAAAGREAAEANDETRLLLLDKEPGKALNRSAADREKLRLEVEEVQLDAPVAPEPHDFPIPKLTRDGHLFLRDGKPVFLLGYEEGEMTVYPFLAKLMGADFFQFHGTRLERILQHERAGDTLRLKWARPLEEEMLLQESLRNGVNVYLNPCENLVKRYFEFFPWIAEPFPELFATFGHFYAYRHDHPDAWKIRSNYWKQLFKYLGRYPVFAYELFNEVSFMDYSPETLARFRRAMAEKYGRIAAANRVWKTSFRDFDSLELNWKPAVNGSYEQLGREVSQMLWNDWLLFSEQESSDAFGMLAKLVRHYQPGSLVTIQSYCGFPFDYGGCAVNPRLKSLSEDIYGDESHFLLPAVDETDEAQIVTAASTMFRLDYLAGLTPGKPLMSEETGVSGMFPRLGSHTRVTGLTGEWRFRPEEAGEGTEAGFHRPDFDDSEWRPVQVPGKWADFGFPQVTVGWYRRAFDLTAGQLDKPIWFNAKRMADRARVYVNGKLAAETAGWSDTVDCDVTRLLRPGRNVIAIRLENTYFSDGRYWGGLRDSLSLDTVPAFTRNQLRPGQLRMWLWHRAIHGENGVVPSYFYAPEGDELSLFRQSKIHPAALADFPKAKYEIESVAELMLRPKPRITGKAALIYPIDTLRCNILPTYAKILKGPLTAELREWYATLLFNGIQLEVVDMQSELSRFRILFMRHNRMVTREQLARLRGFVEAGGVLVRDADSLTVDLESGLPFGKDLLLPEGTLGRGFVRTVAGKLSHAERTRAFAGPLRRAEVAPPLAFSSAEPLPYLESHLLSAGGRHLIYFVNWGTGGETLTVRTARPLPGGRYRIRDLETGKELGIRSASGLCRDGITVGSRPKMAVTLLLEPESAEPLPLRRLSKEQESWFSFLLKPQPEVEKEKRVLFAAQTWAATPVKMLTACRAMDEAGYSYTSALGPVKNGLVSCFYRGGVREMALDEFGILMLLGPFNSGVSDDQAEIIEKWVARGGRLFIAGNTHRAAYGWMKNANIRKTFYYRFGIAFEDYRRILNPERCRWGFPELPVFTGAETPLGEGIREIHTLGSPLVTLESPEWIPAVVAGPGANYPASTPFIAVRPFGKGKIVACGDANFLKPELFGCGDNSKLFLRLLRYLSEENGKK